MPGTIEELRETDLVAMAKLGAWCAEQSRDCCEIDGGALEDKMLELGIITWANEPYDSTKHGESEHICDGETHWLKWRITPEDASAALDRSSKEDGR